MIDGDDGHRLSAPSRLHTQVRLLRVSLTDAKRLMRCYENPSAARDMEQLSHFVFTHEWCDRPLEMT